MGLEPTLSCSAGSRLAIWLQRQLSKCPRWESNPGFDLRRVACKIHHTPRTSCSAPRRGIERASGRFEVCHAVHHTRRVCVSVARPGIEPGPTASEADMLSGTLTGHVAVRRRNLEAKQYQDLWRVGHRPGTMCSMVGGGRLSVTPSRHKSRRLDSHQHQPPSKVTSQTGAFLSRATSASSRSARSRTLLGGFGGRLLPRSTLLYSTFFRVTDGS